MLKRENYTSEHIDALRKQTGADPSILERTVFAFGLLEALCRVKMPFIFKGGTSLLILVGVILDTLQQIESYLLLRHYDGLMKTGRIKGRSA